MSYPRLQHRELSILVGVLVGVLLDVFASTTDSLPAFSLTDLVIFVTIPALSGALAGFADPDHAVGNGIIVGVVAPRLRDHKRSETAGQCWRRHGPIPRPRGPGLGFPGRNRIEVRTSHTDLDSGGDSADHAQNMCELQDCQSR